MHDDCVVYIQKVARVKEILDGKWKLQILCAMRSGPVRLSQLMRLAPAASKKGLRANLRSLESSHLVVRRDLSDSVLHVEYDFEDSVRESVSSLLDHLATWGDVGNQKSV
jgi:DNA-binding HxlR family transcriptional regulator